jgi:hypothetical protein
MTTHWKANFKNFTMKQWFSTCSVLEVEQKFVEVEAAITDNLSIQDLFFGALIQGLISLAQDYKVGYSVFAYLSLC